MCCPFEHHQVVLELEMRTVRASKMRSQETLLSASPALGHTDVPAASCW